MNDSCWEPRTITEQEDSRSESTISDLRALGAYVLLFKRGFLDDAIRNALSDLIRIDQPSEPFADFGTLKGNMNGLDFSLLLPDVTTIADEVDAQLTQTMGSHLKLAKAAEATAALAEAHFAVRMLMEDFFEAVDRAFIQGEGQNPAPRRLEPKTPVERSLSAPGVLQRLPRQSGVGYQSVVATVALSADEAWHRLRTILTLYIK